MHLGVLLCVEEAAALETVTYLQSKNEVFISVGHFVMSDWPFVYLNVSSLMFWSVILEKYTEK